jgi:hypothetical protein
MDKGLGDTIARVTKITGIKKVVDTATKILNVDCGCAWKQEMLNNKYPYKQKPNN